MSRTKQKQNRNGSKTSKSQKGKKGSGGTDMIAGVSPKYGAPRASLWDEKSNLALLVLLYTLQGIPQGLMSTIPLLLKANNASYNDLSFFALAIYPYSFKVFWSPIVDSVFNITFGRRRSWIVPTQMLVGVIFIYLSHHATELIEQDAIFELTILFFALIFMSATQDIAVDGWALTLLSEHNRGYASNCQTCGLNIGIYTAFSGFLAFNSTDFCNNYIRMIPQNYPIITLNGFLYLSGLAFITITIIIAFVVSEKPPTKSELQVLNSISLKKTMSQIKLLLKIKPLITLLVVLVSSDVAFAAVDSITTLKLTENGIPREKIAMLDLINLPITIPISVYIVHQVKRHRYFEPWLIAYKFRLVLAVTSAYVVYAIPSDPSEGWYMALFIVQMLAYRTVDVLMFVCSGAFWSHVSDESIGGTYMTLLATCYNFGKSLQRNVALLLVEPLTRKCSDSNDLNCTEIDGYYVCTAICAVCGIVWFWRFNGRIRKLMDVPKRDWKVYQFRR